MLVPVTSGIKTPQCGVVSKREALIEEFNQSKEDAHPSYLGEDEAEQEVIFYVFDFASERRLAVLDFASEHRHTVIEFVLKYFDCASEHRHTVVEFVLKYFDFASERRCAVLEFVLKYFNITFRRHAANDRAIDQCDQRFRLCVLEAIPIG